VSAGKRGQLADFLRSRRARLTPADVGLPGDSEPGRRRTPGLRREEVAELSGVGVTWYTCLEQGRKITASPQVVDALARALQLSGDEHRHLRELAAAPATSGDDTQARLQRLVDAASRDRVAALLAGAPHGPRGAPVLVVVGGLPATGKSTVASALARQAGFTFVRVDRIEQAIIDSAGLRQPLGPVGYTVAYGVAAEQLGHGVSVVAECVNPLGVTRDAWRDIAAGHGARLVEVELVCTDQAAHRERARTREVDVAGLRLPDWEQITSREYEPWDRDHLVIDTATRTPAEAVAAILAAIPERAGHVPVDPD
jgi:predicted kinase/transcriptional regulator with XRE-family HTH domain